ncbi:hypothetical protein CPT_Pollock82 [Escherichia phage Pollock]|uniref:Uncharacterized protein n=1 Tax=Escherichia phage Pollock TaxID=1540097 RepID=A0A0A0YR23_9CAUD|nr:hypothetical protein ACQ44_gp84 [Escherichia phage Pollock]AIX12441.1 hypothetical protein CPT_Pollock82 [Escherichia phage Pollock]
MASPCEMLGYEEGMRFVVVSPNEEFSVGDTIWLHHDDKSHCPLFRDTEEDNEDANTDYCYLNNVAPYSESHTLAYNRGFRKGDILLVTEDDEDEDALAGDIVTFIHDDGDTCPKFKVHRTGTEEYLYLGCIDSLKPKVGRKVRIIYNCTAGHPSGSEGIIEKIDADGDLMINVDGTCCFHHPYSCVVFGYSEDELSDNTKSEPKTEWTTKPASEWKKGDKGIVRGQQKSDQHNFNIGAEVTFISHAWENRGRFESPSFHRSQTVEYDLIEPIESNKPSETKPTVVAVDELTDVSGKYKYFIDGDSIEVTLVGYFEGEPICAYKDRWGDTQVFVAKPSLLVKE